MITTINRQADQPGSSVKLAQIEINRKKLVEQYKSGLLTEGQLAYGMHVLNNKEEQYSGLRFYDVEEAEIRNRLLRGTDHDEIVYGGFLTRSRANGLAKIHSGYQRLAITN